MKVKTEGRRKILNMYSSVEVVWNSESARLYERRNELLNTVVSCLHFSFNEWWRIAIILEP